VLLVTCANAAAAWDTQAGAATDLTATALSSSSHSRWCLRATVAAAWRLSPQKCAACHCNQHATAVVVPFNLTPRCPTRLRQRAAARAHQELQPAGSLDSSEPFHKWCTSSLLRTARVAQHTQQRGVASRQGVARAARAHAARACEARPASAAQHQAARRARGRGSRIRRFPGELFRNQTAGCNLARLLAPREPRRARRRRRRAARKRGAHRTTREMACLKSCAKRFETQHSDARSFARRVGSSCPASSASACGRGWSTKLTCSQRAWVGRQRTWVAQSAAGKGSPRRQALRVRRAPTTERSKEASSARAPRRRCEVHTTRMMSSSGRQASRHASFALLACSHSCSCLAARRVTRRRVHVGESHSASAIAPRTLSRCSVAQRREQGQPALAA
jgi:hypothetical protein